MLTKFQIFINLTSFFHLTQISYYVRVIRGRNGNLLKSRVSEICVKRIRVNKGRIDRYLDKHVVLDFRTLWLTRISLTHEIFFSLFLLTPPTVRPGHFVDLCFSRGAPTIFWRFKAQLRLLFF